MNKKILYSIFFIFSSSFLQAQEFGNEWIDYSQSYIKIPIGKDALYKITYDDLINAGVPLETIDPRAIQIFHRGIEQAIHIEGQLDAKFDPGDYLIFYGEKNDGTLDKRLYQPASAQPHSYYNLYSDTTSYFLTWKFIGTDGKRMASFKETNTSGIPLEPSHYPFIRKINSEQYAGGRTFYSYSRYSQFDIGEGFTGQAIQENKTIRYTLSGIKNTVQSEGDPILNLLLVGRSSINHRAEIMIGKDATSLRLLGTIDFSDYNTALYQDTITFSDISASGDVLVQVKALGINGGNDLLSTSYIEIIYPQTFDQENATDKEYFLKSNASGKSYIEIKNVPAGAVIYDVTNKDKVLKIGYDRTGTTVKAVIPNTTVQRKLRFTTSFEQPVFKRVNFQLFDPSIAEYIIISHPDLMKPAAEYSDAISAYASYRASVEGGGFDTLVADVLQLYNQFNYGEISPLAIYDFIRWIKVNGTPKFLFLIGEGMEVSYNAHRNPGTLNFKDLVPPAGMPASDVLYSAGLGELIFQPTISTGRLTTSSPEQVINYLKKVQTMETMPYDDLWRKKILHLSGGIKTSEITAFRNYMNSFGSIAEDPYLGGSVKTIQKDTKSTVEHINISEEVNSGLNLVTFFGHSAPSVTDIDIGYVTNEINGYNNKNKYPVFIINGCEAGRFFINGFLFGEDWMLAENKGAIGFIAHTSYGYPFDLKIFTSTFYDTGYGDSIFVNKKLGEIHKETIERFAAKFTTLDPSEITQAQQMLLLGDPATNLFGAKAPDYAVSDTEVYVSSFDGTPVTALSDSFAVNVIIKNFGKAISDSFNVSVQRAIGEKIYNQDTIFKSTLFTDTLQIIIRRNSLDDFGNNIFTINVDADNSISELNENNNTLNFTYFLKLSSTRNLLPYSFSIVNDTTDLIIIQSTDMLSLDREFIIELDTTNSFNSPVLQRSTQNKRLLAEWESIYLSKDTATYFLRSKFANPQPNEINDWFNSSFIRIKDGSLGWGQNKVNQLQDNGLQNLTFDPVSGKFKFEETSLHVDIRTIGKDHPDDVTAVSVIIDEAEYIIDNGRRCRDNTFNLIAFDKESANPYAAIDFVFLDWRTCGRQPQVINSFKINELYTGAGDDIIKAIDNIDVGDSIIIFSIGDPGYSLFPNEVKNKLEEIGIASSEWAGIVDGEPIMIAAKKGASPGKALIYTSSEDSVTFRDLFKEFSITGIYANGSMISPLVGPADQWNELKIHIDTLASDNYSIKIDAIDRAGKIINFIPGSSESTIDLSSLDADLYPYLRVYLQLSDAVNLTAPQIKSWYINYLPSAEGIILPTAFSESYVKQEGDTLRLQGGFFNLSPWNFRDSLSVLVGTSSSAGRIKDTKKFKIEGPQSRDTTFFNLTFPTHNIVGKNDLFLSVNDKIVPEQYYENNTLSIEGFLEVKKDASAPVLDVRFDGIHIFNKDIVSPDPLITIVLKDENQFLQRKDTTGIDLFLKSTCESCEYKRVAFSSPLVNSYPTPDKNEYIIEYKPGPLDNGHYSLRVSAADVSGNKAGEQPYEIEFEVVNESTITHFYPYPNPFSTSVRFIFTLTGNELPDQLLVQVMTISGRVVKEINLSEFGLLRIGNNISDYAWDGRDEFGDRLANGVYLYKVVAKKDGKNIDLRPSAGDELFKKGYGKLYLLR